MNLSIKTTLEHPESGIRRAASPKWGVLACYGCCFAFILATSLQASTSDDSSKTDTTHSQTIQSWDFGRDEDRNKDLVPDQFRRRKGRDYPPYLKVTIANKHPENKDGAENLRRLMARCWLAYNLKKYPWEVVPETVPPAIDYFLEQSLLDPCLEMYVDGGAIEMNAPLFSIDSAFSYAFEIDMDCTDLEGHVAYAELVLLDAQEKVVDRKPTASISGTTGWQRLQVLPIDITQSNIAFGQIRIVTEPKSKGAYKGLARADRIRVYKMPQLSIALNRPLHLFRVGDPIEVLCSASGLLSGVPNIELQLTDHHDTILQTQSLKITRITKETQKIPKSDSQEKNKVPQPRFTSSRSNRANLGWQGTSKWEAPPLPPGFYTLKCQLARTEEQSFSRQAHFCVLPKEDLNPGDKRFGWSLRGIEDVIPMTQLPTFLQLSSIRGVKLPIWFNPNNHKTIEEHSWLIERLKNLDIDIVGVLDIPPVEDQRFFAQVGDITTESIWEQDSIWKPLLDPVLSRACLEISHFQIGWDQERSFTGSTRLQEKIAGLHPQIELYGPSSKLILPWSALQLPRASTKSSFSTLQYFVTEPWTPSELRAFAKGNQQGDERIWVTIDGLSSERYKLSDRLQHLVETMIASIDSQIEKAWLADVLNPDQGWLQSNGQPGPMLVPFRTASQALHEKEYLGKLSLPKGSTCHVLFSASDAVMVLYSRIPKTEEFAFGPNAQAIDMFGRDIPIKTIQGGFGLEQSIEVGPEPIIVRGIDLDVTQWAMGIQIENSTIETTAGGRQPLRVQFANPTSNAVRGTLHVTAPDIFISSRQGVDFRIDAQNQQTIGCDVQLKPDAVSQRSRVRIDVDIHGNKNGRFSVYRDLKIGQEDIELDVNQQVDSDDNLILQLEFQNHTNRKLNFDCMIMLPDRPRERTQVLDVRERKETLVGIKNASNLFGKTIWIRCEEIGSNRIVNQRIVVADPSRKSSAPKAP
ncbi:MAG: hypothetical protein U0905_10860 [Pirellulales bacterium]